MVLRRPVELTAETRQVEIGSKPLLRQTEQLNSETDPLPNVSRFPATIRASMERMVGGPEAGEEQIVTFVGRACPERE
jgi:hypothetical protein